jgi:hypothetical protein
MPEQSNKPPNPGRQALVECDGVRHLAKQDPSGKWRTISRQKELKGVVEIVKVLP